MCAPQDKSDAWRLLHSLASRLDGRAWPERRQQQVLALYRLMDEVLGTRLQVRAEDGAVMCHAMLC